MILAHLPSGYLTGRAFGARRGVVIWAALAGSVFPDLDLLWFYGPGARQVHHHLYWPHVPAFWATLAALALPAIALWARRWLRPACAFLAAIFVHLALDTMAGSILWFWPLSHETVTLVTVPPSRANWVLSFLLHWSILVELAIIAVAAVVFRRSAVKSLLPKASRP